MSKVFRRSLSSLKRAPQLALSEDSAQFATHLNNVFPSLHFPPDLAQRILTHGSHKTALHGHNGRLSFVGMTGQPGLLYRYSMFYIHQDVASLSLTFFSSSILPHGATLTTTMNSSLHAL